MRKRQMHSSMNKSNYYDIEVPQNQPLVKSIAPMNYSLQISHTNKKKENIKSRDHMRYSSNIDTLKTASHRIRHTLLSKSKESEKQKEKAEGKLERKINLLIQKGEPVQRQKSPYNNVIDLQQIQENPTFSARRSVLYPNMDFKRFIKHFSKKQQQQQDSSIFFSDKLNQLNVSEVVRKATHTSSMKVRTPFVHFNLKFLINKKKNLNLENQASRITGSNLPYYQTLSSDLAGKEKGSISERNSHNSQAQKNKYRSIELQLKLQNIQKQVKWKDFA